MLNLRSKLALLPLVLVVFLLMGFTQEGCYADSSDEKQAEAVDNQQEVYMINQPVPAFDFSLERDIAIQLYTIRNEARNTYTVVTSQGTGTPVWMCPSVGYPIPYDVQLTNPLRADVYYSEAVVIEQAEPNGLYSSKNSAGTWVMCLDKEGRVVPVYTELNATAFPFPVEIVDGMIVPVEGEDPTVTIDIDR